MKKSKLIIFFALYFLFFICVNTLHPITTTYVNSLNLPDYYFGFFFSLMSLGQVLGALFFGFLSDKIGRKKLIIIGIIGYCLSQLGFGFINKYPILILLFRILAGFFASAPITLFVSLCLDYSEENMKVKMLSILSSCSILGASFGYEIGGSLYNYLSFSIQQIFITQIIIGLTTALIFGLTMKDVKVSSTSLKVEEKKANRGIKNIKPILIYFLFGLLILTIGQILINKYLDTYLIHIGYQPAILGHYVFITGLFGALSNLLIIPFIKKLKDKKLAICLLLFIFISAGLTYITFLVKIDILYLLFSTHLLYIVLKSLITPLEQNEIATYTNNDNKGSIMGARQAVLSIGNVVGPLIGSAVYTKGSSLIFIVGASIIVLSFVIFFSYYYFKRENKNITK
ncbi:MAG: MFS transporter [Bacilli bacterium]|nr:MFS transporter [Bacillales bacterium]MDY2575571.1 MFS transporter [Bacilli bacterium]